MHPFLHKGGTTGRIDDDAIGIINPATKYVVFRVSSLPLIKARLAGNGCSLVKSRNTEQGQACNP
ncbi:MAG: hypothetical protein ABW121_03465 [Candidatus Thiodiazotropha sp. 6PLUC7]